MEGGGGGGGGGGEDSDDDDDDYLNFHESHHDVRFFVKKLTKETALRMIQDCEAKGYKKICLDGGLTKDDEFIPLVLNNDKSESICQGLRFIPPDDEGDDPSAFFHIDKEAEGFALIDSIKFTNGYPMNEKAEFEFKSRKNLKKVTATTLTEDTIRTHEQMSKQSRVNMSISAMTVRLDDDTGDDMSADDLEKQIHQVSLCLC